MQLWAKLQILLNCPLFQLLSMHQRAKTSRCFLVAVKIAQLYKQDILMTSSHVLWKLRHTPILSRSGGNTDLKSHKKIWASPSFLAALQNNGKYFYNYHQMPVVYNSTHTHTHTHTHVKEAWNLVHGTITDQVLVVIMERSVDQ